MAGIYAHSGGNFKEVKTIPVKNGTVWQNAQEVWAKNGGVWVKVFPNLVREPATGELYLNNSHSWSHATNQGTVFWDATRMYQGPNINSNTISYTVGSWTYYRGAYQKTTFGIYSYAIYRIGRP